MNLQWMREVQQLWAVALHYLESAKALKSDGRTYEAFVRSPDPGTLAASADLDSAAIRLASLDYLLNGGMDAVRTRACSGSQKQNWSREYMHVFLRDAPVEGVDKKQYMERQAWLRQQTLASSWGSVDESRVRLQGDIARLCSSARDLKEWIENDLETWLSGMKGGAA